MGGRCRGGWFSFLFRFYCSYYSFSLFIIHRFSRFAAIVGTAIIFYFLLFALRSSVYFSYYPPIPVQRYSISLFFSSVSLRLFLSVSLSLRIIQSSDLVRLFVHRIHSEALSFLPHLTRHSSLFIRFYFPRCFQQHDVRTIPHIIILVTLSRLCPRNAFHS
jgi:hypothetical protein